MRVLADGTVLLVGEAEDVTSGPREVIFMQLATDGSVIASWMLAGTINSDPLHFPRPGPAMDYRDSIGAGAIITSYEGRALLYRFVRGASGVMTPTTVHEFVYSEPGRIGTVALTDVAFDPAAIGPTVVVTGTVRELPGPGSVIPQTDVYVYREPTSLPAAGGFSKRIGRRDPANLVDLEDYGVAVDVDGNGTIQIAGRSTISAHSDSLYRASLNRAGVVGFQSTSVTSPPGSVTPAYRGLRYSGTQIEAPNSDFLCTVGAAGNQPFLLVESASTSPTAFSPFTYTGSLNAVLLDDAPVAGTIDGIYGVGELNYCSSPPFMCFLGTPYPLAFDCGTPITYSTAPVTESADVRVDLVPFDIPAIRIDFAVYAHSLAQYDACECPDDVSPFKLNELVVSNIASTDNSEFAELKGPPGASLSAVSVIEIDGRSSSAGVVTRVDIIPNGVSMPSDGYYVIGDSGVINRDQVFSGLPGTRNYLNATATYFVLRPRFGSDPDTLATYVNSLLGTDLDATNDGVLDVVFSTFCSVQDVVAITDGTVGAITYTPASFPSLVIGPKLVETFHCSTLAVDRSQPPGIFRPSDYPNDWASTTFTNFDERHPLGNASTPGTANPVEMDEAGYQPWGVDTRGFGGVDWRFVGASLLVDTDTPRAGETPGVEFHAGEISGVTFTWFRPENPSACSGAIFRVADDRAYGISFVPTAPGATTWSCVPGPAFASPSATVEVLNGGSVVATASSSGGLPSLSFNATPLREVKVALNAYTSGASYELTWPSSRNFVLDGVAAAGTVVRITLPGVPCASLSPVRISGLVTGFQIRRLSVTPGPCMAPPPAGAIGVTVSGREGGVLSAQNGGVLLSGLTGVGDGLTVIADEPATGLTMSVTDAMGEDISLAPGQSLSLTSYGIVNGQAPGEIATVRFERSVDSAADYTVWRDNFLAGQAVRVGYINSLGIFNELAVWDDGAAPMRIVGDMPTQSPLDFGAGIGLLDRTARQIPASVPLDFYLCAFGTQPVTVIVNGVPYRIEEQNGFKLLVGVDNGGTLPVSVLESWLTRGDNLPSVMTPLLISNIQVPNPCPADFNQDGLVTVQDIFDFLAAYFNGDPDADFNGVGGLTVQDIFDFLAAYFAGC